MKAIDSQRYRDVSAIAKGGQGVIYAAFDTHLDRRVILKELLRTASKKTAKTPRPESEMAILGSLHHPFIIQILDVLETEEGIYVIQPYYERGSLSQWIGEPGFSTKDRVAVFSKLLEAVAYLHEAGWVHSDINAANVLVSDRFEPVLSDLGSLRKMEKSFLPKGELLGTPGYMAPEQFQGAAPSVLSDIFALGVLLKEILSRKRVVESLETSVANAKSRKPFALSRSDISNVDDWNAIIARATEESSSSRYCSVMEFSADVRRVQENLPILARRATTLVRALKWTRREPLAATVWSLVCLGAFVGTAAIAYGYSHLSASGAELALEEEQLREKSANVAKARKELEDSTAAAKLETAQAEAAERAAKESAERLAANNRLLEEKVKESEKLTTESKKQRDALAIAQNKLAISTKDAKRSALERAENEFEKRLQESHSQYWKTLEVAHGLAFSRNFEAAAQKLKETPNDVRGLEYFILGQMIAARKTNLDRKQLGQAKAGISFANNNGQSVLQIDDRKLRIVEEGRQSFEARISIEGQALPGRPWRALFHPDGSQIALIREFQSKQNGNAGLVRYSGAYSRTSRGIWKKSEPRIESQAGSTQATGLGYFSQLGTVVLEADSAVRSVELKQLESGKSLWKQVENQNTPLFGAPLATWLSQDAILVRTGSEEATVVWCDQGNIHHRAYQIGPEVSAIYFGEDSKVAYFVRGETGVAAIRTRNRTLSVEKGRVRFQDGRENFIEVDLGLREVVSVLDDGSLLGIDFDGWLCVVASGATDDAELQAHMRKLTASEFHEVLADRALDLPNPLPGDAGS